MTSSKKFSFYDAATLAPQPDEKSPVNTEDASPSCSMEEAYVDDVRDEADAIVEEHEEDRANAATHCTGVKSGPSSVNQWLDRANALNEIRMLLKEEIEQDSGKYFVCYIHAPPYPLFVPC
jgi:hypothetical protein